MYFLTQVLFKNDGTFDRSTTDYETEDLAELAFCIARSSAISKQEYKKGIFFIFDEEGTIKFRRVWERG